MSGWQSRNFSLSVGIQNTRPVLLHQVMIYLIRRRSRFTVFTPPDVRQEHVAKLQPKGPYQSDCSQSRFAFRLIQICLFSNLPIRLLGSWKWTIVKRTVCSAGTYRIARTFCALQKLSFFATYGYLSPHHSPTPSHDRCFQDGQLIIDFTHGHDISILGHEPWGQLQDQKDQ